MGANKIIPEATGNGDELFLEEFSGRYFLSSKKAVLEAERLLNESFAIKGFAYLNEFYMFLNLKPSELGYRLGWSAYPDWEIGKQWVEFDHILTDLGITNIHFGRGFAIRYGLPPSFEAFC